MLPLGAWLNRVGPQLSNTFVIVLFWYCSFFQWKYILEIVHYISYWVRKSVSYEHVHSCSLVATWLPPSTEEIEKGNNPRRRLTQSLYGRRFLISSNSTFPPFSLSTICQQQSTIKATWCHVFYLLVTYNHFSLFSA